MTRTLAAADAEAGGRGRRAWRNNGNQCIYGTVQCYVTKTNTTQPAVVTVITPCCGAMYLFSVSLLLAVFEEK